MKINVPNHLYKTSEIARSDASILNHSRELLEGTAIAIVIERVPRYLINTTRRHDSSYTGVLSPLHREEIF